MKIAVSSRKTASHLHPWPRQDFFFFLHRKGKESTTAAGKSKIRVREEYVIKFTNNEKQQALKMLVSGYYIFLTQRKSGEAKNTGEKRQENYTRSCEK